MDAHPDVGAVGICHLNSDDQRSKQQSCSVFPSPWAEVASLLGVRRIKAGGIVESDEVERDVDWIAGSYLFVRRACLEDVGLLDERFFLYDEDIDWCRRAWKAGWKVRYWPGATMIHIGSGVRLLMNDKTFIHFRSRLQYIRKQHSSVAAVAYYVAVSLRLALATGRQVLLALSGRATLREVEERFERQSMFMLLRAGRSGVAGSKVIG